jgi:hypothetical protein
MAVDITKVLNQAASILNASPGAYGTIIDPRRPPDEITRAILNADLAVVTAICKSKNNGYRASFFTIGSLAHGAQIPPHVGAIGAVTIGGKPATYAPPGEIDVERDNPLGVEYPPHFAEVEDKIFHNGAGNASVPYCNPVLGLACQSPDCYYRAVLFGALGEIFPKSGHKVGAGSYYESNFQFMLQMIEAGEENLPEIPQTPPTAKD